MATSVEREVYEARSCSRVVDILLTCHGVKLESCERGDNQQIKNRGFLVHLPRSQVATRGEREREREREVCEGTTQPSKALQFHVGGLWAACDRRRPTSGLHGIARLSLAGLSQIFSFDTTGTP